MKAGDTAATELPVALALTNLGLQVVDKERGFTQQWHLIVITVTTVCKDKHYAPSACAMLKERLVFLDTSVS